MLAELFLPNKYNFLFGVNVKFYTKVFWQKLQRRQITDKTKMLKNERRKRRKGETESTSRQYNSLKHTSFLAKPKNSFSES